MSKKNKTERSLLQLLEKLSIDKVHKLSSIMLTACICYEYGGKWRDIYRYEKNRSVGMLKTILECLEDASIEAKEEVSRIMSNDKTFLMR